jgi:pilus assembly protein Flp/PilA
MGSIKRFVIEDHGADLIEYALLAGLISLACVATLTSVGTNLGTLYGKIKDKLAGITLAP